MDLTYNELHLLIVALERSNRKKKWKNHGDSYAASVLLKRLWKEIGRQETGRAVLEPAEWR